MNKKRIDFNIKKIVIRDYSDYEEGLCNDGGCYAYYTHYIREGKTGMWRIEHYTSADFPYCNVYGRFDNCCQCSEHDSYYGCCCEFERISSKEMRGILDSIYPNVTGYYYDIYEDRLSNNEVKLVIDIKEA